MSVQDGRKRPAFGVIYLDDLQHPAVSGLSDRAFRLWAILCTRSKSGLNGSSRDSVLKVSTLAKSMSTGTEEAGSRKARRALAELEEAGLVEPTVIRARTRHRLSNLTGGHRLSNLTGPLKRVLFLLQTQSPLPPLSRGNCQRRNLNGSLICGTNAF